MHLAGAALCLLFATAPVHEEPIWVDTVAAALAALTGVLLLSRRWSDSTAAAVAVSAGVGLVTFVSVCTTDPRADIYLLWPTLAAAHYLSARRLAFVLVVELAADLAIALQHWPANLALTRWISMSGALLIVALLVARLTSRVHSLLAVLQEQAVTDPLTGLLDRRGLDWQLGQLIKQAGPDEVAVLILVDLDGFKAVNDELGHAAGDRLLTLAAGRLASVLAVGQHVARLGGDEFLVLTVMPNSEAVTASERLRERIRSALTLPYDLDGRSVSVGASLGVAVGTDRTDCVHHLLRAADRAMYTDKAARRHQVQDLIAAQPAGHG